MKKDLVQSDYVLTPEWCAKDMINFFNPSGKILDPCAGLNKIFYENYPPLILKKIGVKYNGDTSWSFY